MHMYARFWKRLLDFLLALTALLVLSPLLLLLTVAGAVATERVRQIPAENLP